MSKQKSGNPTLAAMERMRVGEGEARASVGGTAGKALIMVVLMLISAAWIWDKMATVPAFPYADYVIGGMVAGLVALVAGSLRPGWSPLMAPVYALAEGLVLGGVSAEATALDHPVVAQAAGLTAAIFIACLLLYSSGAIRVTARFYKITLAATLGAFLFSFGLMALQYFGVATGVMMPGSPTAVAVDGVMMLIASMNLVTDLDFIASIAHRGAPRHMEWYGAMSLMVSLVWLYFEALSLLTDLKG